MTSFLSRHPLAQHGGLIFLGQILLVLLVPLVDRGERHTPVEMFAGVIAVSAITVLLLGHRLPAVVLVAVSGLSIVLLLLWGEALPVRQPGTVLLVVAYVWGASLSVRHAFSADIAASQRILCGAASYVMLGFVFAVLHTVLGLAAPAAYVRPLDLEGIREPRWIDFLWLSFSTLTTAGFGDVVPVSSWARLVCTLEAVTGVMFPAIFIARLVTEASEDSEKSVPG